MVHLSLFSNQPSIVIPAQAGTHERHAGPVFAVRVHGSRIKSGMTKEGALSPAGAGRNGRRGAAATGAGGRSPGPELPAAAAWSFPRKSAARSLRPEGAAPHRRAVAGRALRHIRQASPQAPRTAASQPAPPLPPLLFRIGDACAHLTG